MNPETPFADFIVVNIFTVEPSQKAQLLAQITQALQNVISLAPGFISSSIHESVVGTRILTYARWRSQADFETFLHSPLLQAATPFEVDEQKVDPHFYQLVATITAPIPAKT